MTHDELLSEIDFDLADSPHDKYILSIRAVVELHKPVEGNEHLCSSCLFGDFLQGYPCLTIQAIGKELR